MSYTRSTKFVVLADGVSFPDADGKEVRAKKGDVVSGYEPRSASNEVRDGKIAPHKSDGKTADKSSDQGLFLDDRGGDK